MGFASLIGSYTVFQQLKLAMVSAIECVCVCVVTMFANKGSTQFQPIQYASAVECLSFAVFLFLLLLLLMLSVVSLVCASGPRSITIRCDVHFSPAISVGIRLKFVCGRHIKFASPIRFVESISSVLCFGKSPKSKPALPTITNISQ